MISKEKAFSKLESLYEQAQIISITPEITANVIYQVMEEYDNNPLLEPVGTIIQEQQESDLAPLRNAIKQITEELDGVFQQLKNWHNGAKEYDVSEELIIFEEMAKLPIESGLVTPSGQYQSLKRALIFLNRKYPVVTNPLISQFAVLDKNGEIDHFIFAPSLNAWDAEDKKINNIQKTRVWYAWWKLCSAYSMHDPKIFSKDTEMFQFYLRLVYNFSQEKRSEILNSQISENKTNSSTTISIEETATHTIFNYNERPALKIKKDKDSKRFKFVQALQSPRKFSFNEGYKWATYEKITGELSHDEIDDVKNSIKDLNKLFKKELGIGALLKTKGEFFYRNPMYKYSFIK